ncbi:MAG: histidine kinase dimerization/phospho-acceptor domain-containing protein, partial [Lachnospiraceae bacterium]
MTLRRRLSKTNTRILLLALVALLVIGSLVIEIFEKTYLEQIINYAKLQNHSVDVVNLLNDYEFSEDKIEKLCENIEENGYLIYIAKDKKEIYSNFSKRQIEEMKHLKSYVTEQKEADVFVWKTATMIFKDYETKDGTYQVTVLRNNENTRTIESRGENIRWLIPVFVSIGILAIVVIVGISRYFRQKLEDQIMEPIDKLIDGAKRVEDGNFDERVEYKGDEEFERLCNTFNTMQESLKEGIDKVEAYDKARTEMIAGMSHDLKTPLTSIKGYIKGLKDGVANTPQKQEQYLDIAYQKACAMEVLLQKLFDYSKLETGNMPLHPVLTDMGAFIQSLADENEEYLKENNTDILFLAP